MPLLAGTGSIGRETLYWHYPHYWVPAPAPTTTPYSIILEGEWKLIRQYEDDSLELYNLKDDLGEKTNLSTRLPEKVRQLDRRLSQWLQETGAKLPRPNPNYRE